MKRITQILTLLVVVIGMVSWMIYTKINRAALNQALCVAAANGDSASVESLLARGANPNGVGFIPNPDGDCNDASQEDCGPSPALFFAVIGSPGNHPDPMATVSVLLRAGADVNAKAMRNEGATALMWGMSPSLEKLLLAHGAKVDLRDNDGRTALMYAVDSNLGSVQTLVQAGADINARDNRGKTALGCAQPYDNPQDSSDIQRNLEALRIASFLKMKGARQ